MASQAGGVTRFHDAPGGRRGLALIAVLWVLALLSLVAASFTRTTRTEVNLARNLMASAEAEALADAGAYLAILALLDPDPAKRPRADGTAYRLAFAGAEITVSVQDEAGRIDLNAAPDALVQGLLLSAEIEGPNGKPRSSPGNELTVSIRDRWRVSF